MPETPAGMVDDLTATILSNAQGETPVDTRTRRESAPMPHVGDVILGRYRVVAWAGLGSASIVFRGEHIEMHNAVAIKIVNRIDFPQRHVAVGHLRNEAMILGRLQHAHLAKLWDFSESTQFPCVVTDFIDGITLRHLIQMDGRVEQRQAVRAALHVTDVLATLEKAGIVHRDIKPDNVVLSVDGTAKLIDFGLAIMLGRENPDAHGERLTAQRVGTVAYLAPEQARQSGTVDHRADFYSLGATLYHAVTGKLPFSGNNAAQVILRHLEDDPIPPGAIVPNLSDSVSDLILRMMAKRPGDRFSCARELQENIRGVQDSLARF